MDVNATFAAWLRAARRQAGLSQQQVAGALATEGLPVYQQTIAKIEQGQRDVRLDEAVVMARLFGTTLDEALGLKAGVDSVADGRYARRTALLQQMRDAIDTDLGDAS